jgi:hypothetical protein
MAVKEYKVISRCRRDLNAITGVKISGDAEGTTLTLNDEQVKKVLATGAQVYDGDTQVYLSDFAEIREPQAIPDGKCVDDYTNGDKNRINSLCKVFGLPRYRKEPIVSADEDTEESVDETEEITPTEETVEETTNTEEPADNTENATDEEQTTEEV